MTTHEFVNLLPDAYKTRLLRKERYFSLLPEGISKMHGRIANIYTGSRNEPEDRGYYLDIHSITYNHECNCNNKLL